MNHSPTFLYVVEVLTYGTYHPFKIGITNDLRRRVGQLPAMGINAPNLIGWVAFRLRSQALFVEAAVIRHFPKCPRYGRRSREILKVERDDLFRFITVQAAPFFSRRGLTHGLTQTESNFCAAHNQSAVPV